MLNTSNYIIPSVLRIVALHSNTKPSRMASVSGHLPFWGVQSQINTSRNRHQFDVRNPDIDPPQHMYDLRTTFPVTASVLRVIILLQVLVLRNIPIGTCISIIKSLPHPATPSCPCTIPLQPSSSVLVGPASKLLSHLEHGFYQSRDQMPVRCRLVPRTPAQTNPGLLLPLPRVSKAVGLGLWHNSPVPRREHMAAARTCPSPAQRLEAPYRCGQHARVLLLQDVRREGPAPLYSAGWGTKVHDIDQGRVSRGDQPGWHQSHMDQICACACARGQRSDSPEFLIYRGGPVGR